MKGMKKRINHTMEPIDPSLGTSSFTLFLFMNLFVFLSSTSVAAPAGPSPLYNKFVECLPKKMGPKMPGVYSPRNNTFESYLASYIRNKRFLNPSTPKPILIVTVFEPSHVEHTVRCAYNAGIEVKVRSGGHDYEGLSYTSSLPSPFLILDMADLRKITIDMKTETAWVQSGAILGELYYEIAKASNVLAYPAGDCHTLGVGGHISGAGFGNLQRKFGLTVDTLWNAHIINKDGKTFNRVGMREDVFWAIRGGGGGTFGVVTEYQIQLFRVPEKVTVFRVERQALMNFTDMLHKWNLVANKIDNNLFVRLALWPFSEKHGNYTFKSVKSTWTALFLGNTHALMTLMGKSFPELKLKLEDCKEMTWIQSVLYWGNFDDKAKPEALLRRNSGGSVDFEKRKSDYLQTPIPKAGWESICKKIMELGNVRLILHPYGGMMSRILDTDTPFPHRRGNIFMIEYAATWKQQAEEKEHMAAIKSLYDFMTPFVTKNPRAAYLNYRDLDIGVTDHGRDAFAQGEVYGKRYWRGNYGRLVHVKTVFDPPNFFKNVQSIPRSPPL